MDFNKIIANFAINGAVASVTNYGCGHINDTYLVVMLDGAKYILQRINNNVFPNVEGLMNNIVGVTEFIAKKVAKNGTPASEILSVIKTKNGQNYFMENNNYYRIYNFIPKAVSIETTATPHQFMLSGIGFGKFQKLLDGYPASELSEPIANFHNTIDRFAKLKEAIACDKAHRAQFVQAEINFYLSREAYASKVLTLLKSKAMPTRVTHNDTKLNNVLIDVDSDRAVTVIDLDTVMPGSILYDFGDSIRSGANLGAEDEKDLSKVAFSIELFDAFSAGFIGEVKSALTAVEIENMAFGAILMTYECGMRFLTDHLNGDTYFKIHRENHNLDRTRTQMKMIEDMEKALPQMNEIVRKYAK